MVISNAILVPLRLSQAVPISIPVRHIRNTFFGTSLMSGGKGAVAEGNIIEESTVEVEPMIEPIQYWG